MRGHLSQSIALVLGSAMLFAVSAAAKPEIFEAGNLVMKDHGGISPTTLPRHEQAPIRANIHAKIGTKDGTHPPALRQLDIDFDRTLQVHAEGLPTCKAAQLQARSTAAAKRACPDAIVGSGSGEVEVAFPDQAPFSSTGPLVAFNGGVHGKTTLLLIHGYVNVPTPTAVVAEARVTRTNEGRYGMHADVRVPPITGGAGSVTSADLKLGRQFTYRGKRRSYLTASCPSGHYLIKGNAQFDDGTVVHITHVFPCTPRG